MAAAAVIDITASEDHQDVPVLPLSFDVAAESRKGLQILLLLPLHLVVRLWIRMHRIVSCPTAIASNIQTHLLKTSTCTPSMPNSSNSPKPWASMAPGAATVAPVGMSVAPGRKAFSKTDRNPETQVEKKNMFVQIVQCGLCLVMPNHVPFNHPPETPGLTAFARIFNPKVGFSRGYGLGWG